MQLYLQTTFPTYVKIPELLLVQFSNQYSQLVDKIPDK
jgi:hypothetical protein